MLSAIRASGKKMNEQAIPEMIEWLRRTGYTPAALTPLRIIHVAGTKGKGSTSAFASSILSAYRDCGVCGITKTGLYTSPHLRAVRERIQINGAPLSEAVFARYFFEVWDRLEASAAEEGLDPKAKPVYFRFLTLVAFHAYIREGVDSAVFEVGVGGEYDSTNVIEQPTAAGITNLGIDHTGVLGNTIENIAWHKAGVFKHSAAALSVEQPERAMEVVRQRAAEKGLQLRTVHIHPQIMAGEVKLGLSADFQKANASLAVALVRVHLAALGIEAEPEPDAPLTPEMRKGLEKIVWPGRCQVVQEGAVEWCIDGAHTQESLEAVGKWFADRCSTSSEPMERVLIFNQQNRDAPEALLSALSHALQKQHLPRPLFEHAVFSTNITNSPDLVSIGSDTNAVATLSVQKTLASAWASLDPAAETHVTKTVEEAVAFVRGLQGKTRVLVTGSLHLVGAVLEVTDFKD